MKLRRFKTVVLALLVITSLFLSNMLWMGNWESDTPANDVSTVSLPISTSPNMQDVSAPFQLLVTVQKPLRFSLATPGTEPYQTWLKELGEAHLSGLRPVNALPDFTSVNAMEFDFGATLTHTELAHFVPGLQVSPLSTSGDTVYLFQMKPTSVVYLAVSSSGTQNYLATTDIRPENFSAAVSSIAKESPWRAWNILSGSLVPEMNVQMNESRWKVDSQPLIPLVHSFFVNTEALTRIQANPQTVIWTDGSRAVRVNESAHSLLYEDPNAVASPGGSSSDLGAAVDYMQMHGGGPKTGLVFEERPMYNTGDISTYDLRMYADGYPILDSSSDYKISVQRGQVVQYSRPLTEFVSEIDKSTVSIINAEQLTAILHQLAPTVSVQSLYVQLGYAVEPQGTNVVQLVPVYNVYENGTWMYQIDAKSGRVVNKTGVMGP